MSCPKIPLHVRQSGCSVPEMRNHAVDMTPANRQFYAAYRVWRSTGRFPDDPLASHLAGVIYDEEERHSRAEIRRQTVALELLASLLAGPKRKR